MTDSDDSKDLILETLDDSEVQEETLQDQEPEDMSKIQEILEKAEEPGIEEKTETEEKEASPAETSKAFFIESDEDAEIADTADKDLDAFFEKNEQDDSEGKILTVEKRFGTGQKTGDEHWKAWALVAILVIIGVIILNSPVFSMKSYEIIGNERISDKDILNDLDLKEGTNLFRYAVKHLRSTPKVDSRLSTVDVYFKWPSHVKIVVEESQTIGYVYFQGSYLCIDRKGQVASTVSEPDDDLPVITGLTVTSFSIGESMNVEDANRYDAVVTIGTNLRKYGLETVVSEINVRVLDDIVLYSDAMEIRVGSMDDMEQKITIISSVLEEKGIPKGILHIEDMGQQIYIEPEIYEMAP